MGEYESAIYCYRKALSIDFKPGICRALAIVYRKVGRYERSRELLLQALQINPNDAKAHFGLAMTDFSLKNYRQAFQEYEWRLQMEGFMGFKNSNPTIFHKPFYNGEDLTNKVLLIHTEQGFGDSFMFARFIDRVKPVAGKIVMYCRKGLGKLFDSCLGIDMVTEEVSELPDFDYQIPLMSLPHFFDPDCESLNKHYPYIKSTGAPHQIITPAKDKLNVGLVWGAEETGYEHGFKKVPLASLAPLFSVDNVIWHSLQVGTDSNDIEKFEHKQQLLRTDKKLRDFYDTTNAIADLDLIISCDTSVAHLAGAMSKPLWVMLLRLPDWRWQSHTDTSEWYPSARLYCQKSHGEWGFVVNKMLRDLKTMAMNF
jgi:hypothetical protein